MTFTAPRTDLSKAIAQAEKAARQLGAGPVSSSPNVAKLSVSGIGLRSNAGVALGMFRSLAAAGINVELISTSEVRVNIIVAGEDGPRGLQALQAEFSEAMK